ncbi:MAG: hypothetical protein KC766_12685 [Myxococcales bacterium]|nr:hypothetical protein [Myxococcales bacterium]
MSLEKAIAQAQATVPECVAAGYVDMSTGMLLAVRTVDSHPSEVLDLVSAATADLFQGSNVVAIEQLFKQSRGMPADNHHFFKEILVLSDNLIHVFLRGKKHTNHALVLVTRASANIGMVIVKSRAAITAVEAAV